MAEAPEIVFKVAECVPYQLCPKCNGQGTVSKPPYVPGDVHEWSSSQCVFTCDICEGTKIISMHLIQKQMKDPLITHEALDRTILAASYIETYVCTHPFFKDHPDLKKKLDNAISEITDVYQEIGKISVKNDRD